MRNSLGQLVKMRLDTLIDGFRAYLDTFRYKHYRRKYDIHPTFRFNGPGIQLYGDGKIAIGHGSYLGSMSSIQSVDGHTVEIGVKCSISHNVRIYTMNREPDQDMSSDDIKVRKGDVKIGDYCWIGVNVFIREGVVIGDNCVIGANSVVTCDLPSDTVCGGVPAKVLYVKAYAKEK